MWSPTYIRSYRRRVRRNVTYVAEAEFPQMQISIADFAFFHGLTRKADRETKLAAMYSWISFADSEKFGGPIFRLLLPVRP